MAAAAAATHEQKSGGLPQLNASDFAPQLIWLAITFVTLYLVMARVALPRIGEVLEARAERIRTDLDRAAKVKSEADAVLASYEKSLADARARAQAQAREQSAELAALAAERQAKVAAELGERTKAAEQRIARAKADALANIRQVASDTAQAAAERLVGIAIDRRETDAAVATIMSEQG
jgi:F-type H+-transporting ATPase subunit b